MPINCQTAPPALLHRLVCLLLLLLAVLYGCSDGRGPTEAPHIEQESIPEVEVVPVTIHVLATPVVGFGTLAALQNSAIGALVEGPIEHIFVQVGDRVSKGQPLFKIRQTDYERRLSEALAALNLARAEAELASARGQRLRALKSRNFVSPEEVESAETTWAIAKARVLQAEALAATAQQALEDTTVDSPYDGVVTARNVGEGVYLSTFGSGGRSSVLEIQEVGTLVAVVSLPQGFLGQLQPGSAAKLFIEGRDHPIDSYVAVINDRVDAQARTVELRLPFRNPEYAVKPGLSVRAEIQPRERKALVIPRRAVTGDSAVSRVFIVADSVALSATVTTRILDFDHVEVTSGLSADSTVIVNPPSNLRDGSRVKIKTPSPEDASKVQHVAR